MEQKNYTEVFIDGTVFTLGGTEDEAYLRQVAAYLNEKIGEVRKLDGFSRQSPEYQNLTIQLNLSDDYFKEQMRADDLKQQKEELEKDAYSLKHELITTQMKYEAQSRELEVAKAAPLKDREELEAAKEKLENASQEIESLKNHCENTRQELAAAKAENESVSRKLAAEKERFSVEIEQISSEKNEAVAERENTRTALTATQTEAESLRADLENA